MLRLVCMSALLLLLCACGPSKLDLYLKERDARHAAEDAEAYRISQEETVWPGKLEKMAGKHINEMIQVLGSADASEPGRYHWSKSETTRGGGYTNTTYSKQAIYDTSARITGYYDAPSHFYVEPWEITLWCKISADTTKQGIITHAEYTGHIRYCISIYPLP